MIKSYVINLDRNPERMQLLAARFDELGLSYERFRAYDGNTFSEDEFQSFKSDRPLSNTGDSLSSKPRKWSKGSMGCFLSHYAAWKLAANSPDPYTAIFEDDVYLADSMKEILSRTDWIPEEADIVHLEPSHNRIKMRADPASSIDGRNVHKVVPLRLEHSWPVGAAAIILKREAAQRLINMPISSHVYTDLFLFNALESPVPSRLTVYQMSPAPCIQDKFFHKNVDDIIFKSNVTPHEFYIRNNLKKRIFQKSQSLYQVLRGCKRVEYAA